MTGKKLVVVTGASTGIGYELADIAAKQGFDLLIVANESAIQTAADTLRQTGASVDSLVADLSTIKGVDLLIGAARERHIDILCANAGAGHGHAFLDQTFEQVRATIDTNITGTVYLLHRVLSEMVARHEGKILVTGSVAGYVPGAFNATYNATKAFIDNFTDAVRNELKDVDGVSLTTLMPGATETAFFARADMLDTQVGKAKKADPAKVARDGWDAMMAGKATIISGWMNKLMVTAAGVAPPAILAEQHRKIAEPGGA